jgi:hypothetical protein
VNAPNPNAAPREPPRRLELTSTSRSADAGYLALADLAQIAADLDADYRIVGGHMVTLLVAAYQVDDQVPLRETLDADFGALPHVIADSRLPDALRRRGYAPSGAANRFARRHHDSHGWLDLVVDVLAPSYEGRLLPNQQHGNLVVDEIPGLAFALARPATMLELRTRLLDGSAVEMRLALPDLTSALCIKALAYRGRYADKDAVDLWRLMNAAHAAGLRSDTWPSTATGHAAGAVLRDFFGRVGARGLQQATPARVEQTRMRAFIQAMLPPQ